MIDQRKIVSVVFADLVESTALAESVDVEQLAGILGRYFDTLRNAVESHGGTVEKFIGDAVVGVFGVPVLREDDALRAIRAAVAMRSGIDDLNADLEQASGIHLALRVGINTGEVAVTQGGALGHALSMAARLEQAAQPGQILIGTDTYALAGPSLEAEPVEPLTVKGSSVLVKAWSVTAVREMVPRGSKAGSGFVGRESELTAIGSAFQSAVHKSTCVRVAVLAPPGMGKSRLVAEAASRIGTDARTLAGRCVPYGEGTPYAPLVEIVDQLTPFPIAAELDALLHGQPDAAAVTAGVRATVTGAASVSPDETAWAFRRMFEALAQEKPLVVILDDLHWADPLLLGLIDYVTDLAVGAPILLLCAARPEVLDLRPDWMAPSDRSLAIPLHPLTAHETEGLLGHLGSSGLDVESRQRIVETSGGVPLFIEQLTAFEAENGSTGAIPPTIRALLAARVDRLKPDEIAILERAAIEGQTFRSVTVLELLVEAARPDVEHVLRSLVQQEFIRPTVEVGAGGDSQSFEFSHALIRDAVYEAMPRRLRADLHERYGDLIEATNAAPELVGHHLAAARGELTALGETSAATATLAVRAGRGFLEAGRNSLARRESRRPIELLRRSEELLRSDTVEWLAAVPTLISALVDAQDYEAADRLRDEAVATAKQFNDETAELRAQIAWAESGYARDLPGWQSWATEMAERAVNRFAAADADADIVAALLIKVSAQSITDVSPVTMIQTLKEARRHAKRANDEAAQIMIWDVLSGAMIFGDTPYSELAEYAAEELRWGREHGIPFSESDARLTMAYVQAGRGEFEAARESLEMIRDRLAGFPGRISHYGESYLLSGQIERDAGDPAAAVVACERAIEVFEHNLFWRRNAMILLAHTLIDLGRLDDARALLDRIGSEYESTQTRSDAEKIEAEARYLGALGDVAGAVQLARQAAAMADPIGDPLVSGRAHEVLATLLLAGHESDEARLEFDRARALFAQKEYRAAEARVSAALSRLDA